MSEQKRIVIIGAGPTGLGAAWRLRELEHEHWLLYEQHSYAGGHSSSEVDAQGFTWDEGGHVIFSHYPYFDRLIEETLKSDFHERVRESWIFGRGNWIPYPFQNNLRYLPKSAQVDCLVGAAKATGQASGEDVSNFRSWILATFGEGIASHFMFPYNRKVWTTPLEQMAKSWIAERVAVIDFKRLLENVVHERDDVGWGPNSKFKFPLRGGTGEIYRGIARSLGERVQFGKELVEVDTHRRTVSFADGTGDKFDALVSTAPLDLLIAMLKPRDSRLLDAAHKLAHNSLLVLGIGLKKKIDTNKCWVYFVDEDMPCYRCTFFSQYSPFHVPNGDVERYSSLMCEMSYPVGQSPDRHLIMEKTIDGLIRADILTEADRQNIISRHIRDVAYSYPIPTLERDAALDTIQPALLEHHIYSRGRFGAWKYEVGNMDHSVQMGVEAIDSILLQQEEKVVRGK
jgi:protoporphyrinogen oxidase